jgi:hypothetical protein
MGVQLIADGPTRYLVGSMMTAVGTREPGAVGVVLFRQAASASPSTPESEK